MEGEVGSFFERVVIVGLWKVSFVVGGLGWDWVCFEWEEEVRRGKYGWWGWLRR